MDSNDEDKLGVTPQASDSDNGNGSVPVPSDTIEAETPTMGVIPPGDCSVDEEGDSTDLPREVLTEPLAPQIKKVNSRRTSSRNKSKHVLYRGMCNLVFEEFSDPTFNCLPHAFSSSSLPSNDTPPKSLKAALLSFYGPEWRAACVKEITSLFNKKVWTLFKRPTHKKVIRGMWLFKRKLKLDGTIKHKSRYVAMGNTQVAGEDFGETFSPTGKPLSLRLLVAVAALRDGRSIKWTLLRHFSIVILQMKSTSNSRKASGMKIILIWSGNSTSCFTD